MSAASTIEWTDATWNPVRGCSIVSKGCTNCYAMKQAHRFSGPGRAYEGLTTLTDGGPVWTGKVRTMPELLEWPIHTRTPKRIFVNSMSDLFHDDVPDEFIDQVFAVMCKCCRRFDEQSRYGHTFQVLTKRAERMARYMADPARVTKIFEACAKTPLCGRLSPPQWPLPNVWLGVSVEDQAAADERIPLLLQTPAAVRWISAEPLLGPIDLTRLPTETCASECCGMQRLDALTGRSICDQSEESFDDGPRIDWVVAGGESGPGARPMAPGWVRDLRDQCRAARVHFFFKQWGDFTTPARAGYSAQDLIGENRVRGEVVGGQLMVRVGKRTAGRVLDGRTHDEYPA